MKIVVTGASGFVGSRVCSHLEEAGHDIIRVSHSNHYGFENEYLLDIAAPGAFEKIEHIGGIDAIVHCAGIAHRFGTTSKEQFWRVNLEGSRNVAEFAARNGVGRFVHLSSVLVYGIPTSNQPVTEDHKPDPKDDYAASKLAGEMAVAEACESAGILLTILRPVPIIGEGSRGNVARLIRAIRRGRFAWIGDGRNERSFVYVSDVAAAVATALSLAEEKSILNVTGGHITVREMVETISEALGSRRPISLLPYRPARFAVRMLSTMSHIPMLDRYHRILETWLADAVFSGDAYMSLGFKPTRDIREGFVLEVESYLASKR